MVTAAKTNLMNDPNSTHRTDPAGEGRGYTSLFRQPVFRQGRPDLLIHSADGTRHQTTTTNQSN